eukprot:1365906-Pyramimonas_sp.AAC.1
MEAERRQMVAGMPRAPEKPTDDGAEGLKQLIASNLTVEKCGDMLEGFGGDRALAQKLFECLAEAKVAEELLSAQQRRA